MNEYLDLFGTFAKVGVMTFGGGYAMLPILQREVVENKHWATEEELMDYYAISQCTPGVIAVNIGTFIGQKYKGVLGGIVATLGVVLPSFFIILLIAAVLRNLMKYAGVEAFLSGVRPCVVAMILATALTMALSTLLGITRLGGGAAVSVRSVAVFGILWAVHFAYKKAAKKAPSPIGMIVLAAGLGIVFWGV